MALVWSDVKENLFEIINQLTPSAVAVIFSDQTAAQPDPPYMTIKVINGPQKIGSVDDRRFNQSSMKFETKGIRELTLSVNAFGNIGEQLLIDIMNKLEQSPVVDFINSKSLSVMNSPSITNLSDMLSTVNEQRFQMDLIFNLAYDSEIKELDDSDLTSIETVSGSYNFGKGDVDFIINE